MYQVFRYPWWGLEVGVHPLNPWGVWGAEALHKFSGEVGSGGDRAETLCPSIRILPGRRPSAPQLESSHRLYTSTYPYVHISICPHIHISTYPHIQTSIPPNIQRSRLPDIQKSNEKPAKSINTHEIVKRKWPKQASIIGQLTNTRLRSPSPLTSFYSHLYYLYPIYVNLDAVSDPLLGTSVTRGWGSRDGFLWHDDQNWPLTLEIDDWMVRKYLISFFKICVHDFSCILKSDILNFQSLSISPTPFWHCSSRIEEPRF